MTQSPPPVQRSDFRCIRDARGRQVRQLDAYALWVLRRSDIIPAEELAQLARKIGSGLVRTQRLLSWLILIGLVVVLFSVVERGVQMVLDGTFNLRALGRGVNPLLAVWGATVAIWATAREVRMQRTTAVMLAGRYCPHCGYNLRELPVDPRDGATVCPECGCAWTLPATASVESAPNAGAGPPPHTPG